MKTYAIELLETQLDNELKFFADANSAFEDGGLNNELRNAFMRSQEIARERIPVLKKALELLRNAN